MIDGKTYYQHKIEWTPQAIARFWDYKFKTCPIQFKEHGSEALLKKVFKHIPKPKTALDYGCGTGGLLAALLKRNIESYAMDISRTAEAIVSSRFLNDPNFKGYFTPGKLNLQVDTVFLTEVIEHIPLAELSDTFDTLRNVFASYTYVVVTVPYKEKLENYITICPDCGAVFNNRQHVESYDEEKLIPAMEVCGFEKVFCAPVNLSDNFLRGALKRTYRAITRTPHSHPTLLYIGLSNNV